MTSRCGSQPDEPAFAEDTNRVEHKEGVIAQPSKKLGLKTGQRESEEGVADDLGNGPGDEHGRVERRESEEGKHVDDGPDEEEARGDLHKRSEQRSANDACVRSTYQYNIPT